MTVRRLFAIFICVLFLACLAAGPVWFFFFRKTALQTHSFDDEFQHKVLTGIVQVLHDDTPVGTGTIVGVTQKFGHEYVLVLTAAHLIYRWPGDFTISHYPFSDSALIPVDCVYFDAERDTAFLAVSRSSFTSSLSAQGVAEVFVLPISPDDSLPTRLPVLSPGFDKQHLSILTTSTVRRDFVQQSGKKTIRFHAWELAHQRGPGAAGAPLIDEDGLVVGFVTAPNPDAQRQSTAVSIRTLQELDAPELRHLHQHSLSGPVPLSSLTLPTSVAGASWQKNGPQTDGPHPAWNTQRSELSN